MIMKLIKSGDIVASNKLKTYFLSTAKKVQLVNETDPKKLDKLMQSIDNLVKGAKNQSEEK